MKALYLKIGPVRYVVDENAEGEARIRLSQSPISSRDKSITHYVERKEFGREPKAIEVEVETIP